MRAPLLSLPAIKLDQLQAGTSLILADGLSSDLAPLLAGARLPLAMLPPKPEPLAAITDQLRRARRHGAPITTLHLVAHGRSGAVRFGNRWITTASLVAAASDLALWNVERIALWSCHTGADPGFTATLAELTGAQVLASPALIDSLAGHTISSTDGETLQLQALFTAPAITAWAGSLANEYTLTNQQLDFTFAPDDPNRTVLLSGGYDASTGRLLPGTQYLYKNVVTVDGNVIDAIVCINAYQKAYVTAPVNFDNNQLQYSADVPTTDPSYDPVAPSYFQPNIEICPTSRNTTDLEQYVDFTVSFVETNPITGSRDLVILKNLVIDIFDVDGNGASQTARQFVEIDDVGNYVVADNTNLVVTTGIGGEGIRFSAPPNDGTNYTDKPETPIGDTVRAQVRYPGGVSTFNFQLGDYAYNNRLGGYNALYALDFGAGRDFSVPTDEFGLKAETVCVAECGNQALITVCLVGPKDANGNPTRPPSADVTVDLYDFFNRSTAFGSLANVVTNADGSLTVNNEFTVSTSRLVFTTANWSQPQTITVTGLDDNVIDGNFIFNALLRTSTSDPYYNRLSTGIDIKNLDNDTLITASTVFVDAGYSTFEITAAAGRTLLLTAVDLTTTGIGNASIETSTDGGTTWTAYNATSGFKVPGVGAVTFKARVNLAPLGEVEGTDTFKLIVSSPGVPCAADATATVVGLACIGDRVWLDANANGQQDAGEVGLAGVSVELYASVDGLPSGPALATKTTDANGNYCFTEQPGGAYILRFVTPSGYYLTAANIGADTTDSDAGNDGYSGTYTVPIGTQEESVDAGLYQLASIAGTVFADTNNNGLQDNGETGIAGVTVTISGTDGQGTSVFRTTTTASDGTYSFADLVPGTYTVSESQPSAYLDGNDAVGSSGGTLAADQVSGITLASGTNATAYNFGELLPASISGTVFSDANNNGIQNNGETGIAGVTITLSGTDDLGNAVSLTTTTGVNGNYSFNALRPGTYTVSESQPGGYLDGKDTAGSPGGGSAGNDVINSITLSSGMSSTGNNFGELLPASLGNRLWVDANGDGLQNDGATGIAGRTVTLLSGGADGLLSTTGDNTSTTTTTAADGIYGFANLTPGEYRVLFGDKPTDTVFTSADAGTDDTVDSDADGSGLTGVITLVAGQANNSLDAGVYAPVSLGDFVWEDSNANGIQDGTEAGLGGITVYLTDASGNRVVAGGSPIATTTDANGAYSFQNLRPGTYGVEVSRPNGYLFSAKDQGSDDTVDSDVDAIGKSASVTLASGQSNTSLDAGLYRTASLGDTVWHDLNANGIQDSGETGIAGATVFLLDGNGNRISQGGVAVSTTTDANGKYSFSGLTPGSYAVEVVKPSGYDAFSSRNQGTDTAFDSNIDPTTGKSEVVELSSGEVETSVDAGLYKLANLGDRVWSDTNANGIQETGETGTAGLTVELYDSTSTTLIRSTTTGADGIYSFSGLTPGDYVVKFSKPVDAYFSDLGKGSTTTDTDADANGFTGVITLASGETNTSIDAGFNKLGSIGDFVWLDTNANGIQDAGEAGFGGQLVELFDEKFTTLLATTTTDANGAYNFSGLKASKYAVRFNKPVDYVFTDKDLGSNDSTDSDADTSTGANAGRTGPITVNSGQAVTSVDAGLYKLASIGDRVWNDANSNGIQDGTEVGIANVAVSLWADGTTQVGTTTTNAAGNYSFVNLKPGTYQVWVTTPTGFTATTKGANPTSATDSNIDATGRTDLITLGSGEANLSIDAGYTLGGGSLPGGGSDLQITKSDGLTNVVAGQRITYTIDVKNVGSSAVSNALVSDVMPTNLSNVTWTSAVLAGTVTGNDASGTGNINDTITSLGANSTVRYTVSATVVKPGTATSSTVTNFNLNAATNSAATGAAANSRSFTSNGVTLTARAFSRELLGCNTVNWTTAYLGNYTTGLGITNGSETGSSYRLDNAGGQKDYLLLQFSESVVLDKAYLKSVLTDSDASFWIGNAGSTLTSLSDAALAALGYLEQNSGASSDRTADVNAGNLQGNTIVIAAANNDTTCNDNFTLSGLDVFKLVTTSSTITNTATVAGPIGFTDPNLANNSATDVDTILSAPGCRTPGFWVNKSWSKFWDGIAGNEPSQSGTTNFAKGDLFLAPYTSSQQQGKVMDNVTGTYQAGVLIGDWNRNGLTENGEQTIFYTTAEALKVMDSSQQPDKSDVRYTLARSLTASWLNHLAGNPVDTAATNDVDARVLINRGITWLQTYTPDENTPKDGKGDGMLSKLSSISSPYMKASNTAWSTASTGGNAINTGLDNYNNGRGLLADGLFYGGNA